jgi:hypothetical protein
MAKLPKPFVITKRTDSKTFWHTPKITVRRAWQMFESKDRVLGPPKSKKSEKPNTI